MIESKFGENPLPAILALVEDTFQVNTKYSELKEWQKRSQSNYSTAKFWFLVIGLEKDSIFQAFVWGQFTVLKFSHDFFDQVHK